MVVGCQVGLIVTAALRKPLSLAGIGEGGKQFADG